jgi:hypothetical protein
MTRNLQIINVIKKCVTNGFPMVKDISITQGIERGDVRRYGEPFIIYYTIHIEYTNNTNPEKIHELLSDKIHSLKSYFFEKNEFIYQVRIHTSVNNPMVSRLKQKDIL